MSSELLFECIIEEIPPKMQGAAVDQIKNYINEVFSKGNVEFQSVNVFITARRFVIFIDKINARELNNEVKGPNVNASKKAIDGFLRKTQKSIDELSIRKIKNESFYFANHSSGKVNLEEFSKRVLEEMLKNFSWPKSMRWGDVKERWIRPIQSMLCIVDDKMIPVTFAGITASNITSGHRFLSEAKEFVVSKIDDYFDFLDKNYVILDQNKRMESILKQIRKLETDNELQLEENDKLLNELNGMVEHPIVLLGKVGDFGLPREVILSVMYNQQKYLAFKHKDSNKISHFATVVSTINDQIVRGYEKVLSARLTDAQFLINQDKKYNLDYYGHKLNSILFHDSLGSIAEKVKRITALAKYIAIWVPHASLLKVERAAMLAKADLTTSMVKEFPELQGMMGGYYATCFCEDKEVIEAITDHYLPLGPGQKCPTSSTTIAVALADKADHLIGLVAAGEKFSSSSDLFALRRNAIGLIRIILENNLNISINLLLDKSVSLYPKFLFNEGIKVQKPKDKLSRKQVVEVVLKFCLERFQVILKGMNVFQNVIEAVLAQSAMTDLLNIKEKAVILNDYINTQNGNYILSTYKRMSSIINKSSIVTKSKKINKLTSYNQKLLVEKEEIVLSEYINTVCKNMKRIVKENDFTAMLDELAGFYTIANNFMDNVQINCDSKDLRENRLNLIANVCTLFELVSDFNKILK